MKADFGQTATDCVRCRAGFSAELFDRLSRMGIGTPGQRLLDVGTGAGVLARVFASRGCGVTGVDPSLELLSAARRLDQADGVSISYIKGVAEETGLCGGVFEAVTAAVCWHWFDADRAAQEIRRILVPGGALAIIHFDWLAYPGSVAADSEHLMRERLPSLPGQDTVRKLFLAITRKVKPEWVESEGSGIHPNRLVTLARNGFHQLESFSFDVAVPYTHEAWRGRLRSHAALDAVRKRDEVERLDLEMADVLEERHPEVS